MKLKVLLFAYGHTGECALKALSDKFNVIGIITPEDSSELYRYIKELEVEKIAKEKTIEIFRTSKMSEIEEIIDNNKPDIVVISSFNKIIPERILKKSKFINVHHGDLPRYRGRANFNWAIINGRKEIGLTIHEVVANLDAGNIYAQYNIQIEDSDNIATVYSKANKIILDNLSEIVEKVSQGFQGKVQEGEPTYCCTRLPEDGIIDWKKNSREIYNLIRGLTHPYDGAYTFYKNKKMIIWEAELVPNPLIYEGRIPGRIIKTSEDYVDVLTRDSYLKIKTIEYEGIIKKPNEIIKSVKDTLGINEEKITKVLEELEKSKPAEESK